MPTTSVVLVIQPLTAAQHLPQLTPTFPVFCVAISDSHASLCSCSCFVHIFNVLSPQLCQHFPEVLHVTPWPPPPTQPQAITDSGMGSPDVTSLTHQTHCQTAGVVQLYNTGHSPHDFWEWDTSAGFSWVGGDEDAGAPAEADQQQAEAGPVSAAGEGATLLLACAVNALLQATCMSAMSWGVQRASTSFRTPASCLVFRSASILAVQPSRE